MAKQVGAYPAVGLLRLFGSVILCSVFLITANTRADWPLIELNESQRRQLETGEVLMAAQAGATPRATMAATILIDAPAERIWAAIMNCRDMVQYMPPVEECRVLSSGENWGVIRQVVKWNGHTPRISCVFQVEYTENRRVDFRTIEGDLHELRGSWLLMPTQDGGRTLVRYEMWLDFGFWVPGWLIRRSLRNELPDILKGLRTHVMAGSEMRPIPLDR